VTGILVLNAGSSSLRYRLLDPASGQDLAAGHVEDIGGDGPANHDAALDEALDRLTAHGWDAESEPPIAVGHRVVHGGPVFGEPKLIDDAVVADLESLEPLAPLHIPASLAGIRATRRAFPTVPQVAVFDTFFHASLPPEAHTYAVPRSWRERHGVRRYGFHGTSFAYVAARATSLLGVGGSEANLILLHLGNGASACAVRRGRSIDTSMGLTPVEGLVMGTRSGDVDPSLGGYLARVAGIGPEKYDDELNHGSGLVGLAGTADWREVEERRAAGDADAALAFDVAAYRLRKYIGAYAVALEGVDAIVFTGGIGEHSPQLRAAVLGGLGVLGVELDVTANQNESDAERLVTTAHSHIAAYVIPTNEELEIARVCMEVVGAAGH
jgi:acetate kinase